MRFLRLMALTAGATAVVGAQATIIPVRLDMGANYALTNSGSDMRDSAQIDLTGIFSNTFGQVASHTGSGGESASSLEEGSIGADMLWLHATAGGTVRASASATASYRFQVSGVTTYRLDYKLQYQPLVWWDTTMVQVIDHTASVQLDMFRDANTTDFALYTFDPAHVYSVYVGVNHNNLNQFSYPAGDKSYFAEATLTPVPEPMSLLALGAGTLALLKRRR